MISDEMKIILQGIRRLWTQYSPTRRYLLNSRKRKVPKLKADGTPGKVMINVWECEECQDLVSERDVDHIKEVGKMPETEEGLPAWVGRLFCEASNLQILCKSCHKKKTASSRKKSSRKRKR